MPFSIHRLQSFGTNTKRQRLWHVLAKILRSSALGPLHPSYILAAGGYTTPSSSSPLVRPETFWSIIVTLSYGG
jgi:hypothetical protein